MSVRVSKSEYKKFLQKHSDMTMEETIPDASKQFAALKRTVAKQEKRIRTLEAQVQPLYGEYVRIKTEQRGYNEQ